MDGEIVQFGAGMLVAHRACHEERSKRIDGRPGVVEVYHGGDPPAQLRKRRCYFCHKLAGDPPGDPWAPRRERADWEPGNPRHADLPELGPDK